MRAAILLADHARPEAEAAVRALEEIGVRPAIVSGDGEGPIRRLAGQLGIADVFFRCGPTDKEEIVRKACESGQGGVAMVGDGINDAPALTAAHVGIATGGGTDLARESSDVTLLGDDLSRIPWVIGLSRSDVTP